MKSRFGHLSGVLFALVGMIGCDSEVKAPEPSPPPPRVSYSSVAPARRSEFATAVAVALRDFDDLYGQVLVSVNETPGGPEVVVEGKEGKTPGPLERALGVALANFEFTAPGMRFVAVGDCSWKILFPADMQIPAEGTFNLALP